MDAPPAWSPTIAVVRRALAQPLPGQVGQRGMEPAPLPGRPDRWGAAKDCRDAGVLLLLYPHLTAGGSDLYIALTRRTEYPGVHSGQISLPGGRREGDESLQTTALRETMEEIGVLPETLEVIGGLTMLYIIASHFCIYPFVAYSPARPAFRLDPGEVAELIEAPLSLLLDPATRQEEWWPIENYGRRRVPFFNVFGHQVWGATAMILNEFLMALSQTGQSLLEF